MGRLLKPKDSDVVAAPDKGLNAEESMVDILFSMFFCLVDLSLSQLIPVYLLTLAVPSVALETRDLEVAESLEITNLLVSRGTDGYR